MASVWPHRDAWIAQALDVPHAGGPVIDRQEARGPFAQLGRVEGDTRVGAVDRLAAHVVDRVARGDERGDIRDREAQPVPVRGASEVERLVQAHRAGRVDRGQLEVALVASREPRRAVDAVVALQLEVDIRLHAAGERDN